MIPRHWWITLSLSPTLGGRWILRPAVAGRRTGYDSTIGKCHASGVHQVRSILGTIAVDNHRISQFEVTALEPPTRQGPRRRRGEADDRKDESRYGLHVDVLPSGCTPILLLAGLCQAGKAICCTAR